VVNARQMTLLKKLFGKNRLTSVQEQAQRSSSP